MMRALVAYKSHIGSGASTGGRSSQVAFNSNLHVRFFSIATQVVVYNEPVAKLRMRAFHIANAMESML
jgi:hypothetical protein